MTAAKHLTLCEEHMVTSSIHAIAEVVQVKAGVSLPENKFPTCQAGGGLKMGLHANEALAWQRFKHIEYGYR